MVWNEQGCELVVKTTVKNIGIAPAQDVVVDGKIVASKRRGEYKISDAINEPQSGMVGHLLFPNAEFAPSKKLRLTHDQVNQASAEGQITVVVIIRYLSTMDRKSAQTIRFYDLKRIPEVADEEITYPVAIKVEEGVPKDMLFLTHYWMPSYAD